MVEAQTKEGMLCPVCRVDLMMTDRQGVEVDYCPKCRGIWLDGGELDKIIERSATGMAPLRPAYAEERGRRYRDYDDDEDDLEYRRGLSVLFGECARCGSIIQAKPFNSKQSRHERPRSVAREEAPRRINQMSHVGWPDGAGS